MERKNKKTLIIMLMILSMLVLGMGGYIVYDKVIKNTSAEKKDSNENNNENNINIDKNNENQNNNSNNNIDSNVNNNDKKVELQKGTYKNGEKTKEGFYNFGYGSFQVEGYTTISELDCTDSDGTGNCYLMGQKLYKFIDFNFLRIENPDFIKYMEQQEAITGSKKEDRRISLGCLEDLKLKYTVLTNDRVFDWIEEEFSINDTAKLLSSFKSNPIILEIDIPEQPAVSMGGCLGYHVKIISP